jgi:hypothetical protein
MTPLHPQELAQFARKYRFPGGRRSSIRIRTRGSEVTVEVTLRVNTAIKDLGDGVDAVRLKLLVVGAEEYRFQKRLNSSAGKLSDVKFSYFNGLFFVNFDAWGLQPGEVPGVHDFRASDAFVAGRELHWEEVAKPAAG